MIELLLALVLAIAPTYDVTGYTEFDHCDPDDPGYKWCDGLTASNEPVRIGHTLSCPPEIAFSAAVWIEGVGWRWCKDRGSDITAGKADVLVATPAEARDLTGPRRVVVLGRRVTR